MQFPSTFVYNTYMTEYFKHEGKIPDNKHILCTLFKVELIQTKLILCKVVEFHHTHIYF